MLSERIEPFRNALNILGFRGTSDEMFIMCKWQSSTWRGRRRERSFFFREWVLARERGLSVNSIFQRVRDKGRSLPQAPPPAVAGCHPRHFDIDEGNLREHCWRRRLMRRVRARAPRLPGPSRTHRATPRLPTHRFLYYSFSMSIVLPAAWWIAFRHPTRPCERLSCETAPSFDVLLPRVKLPTLPRYRDQMTPMSNILLSFFLQRENWWR